MCLPVAGRLARVSFHGGSHRAPSASAFQVFAVVVLVPLANASHLGKPQVSVGGSYPRVWMQGGVNKSDHSATICHRQFPGSRAALSDPGLEGQVWADRHIPSQPLLWIPCPQPIL